MSNYYHFNTINSTSKFLKDNYQKYNNFTYVSADYQTDGHGRCNRKWISKKGENLLFSILIKDKNLIKRFSSLSLLSALCIVEVLESLNIKDVSIKWPNDVFVSDKKIAGILLESISYGSEIEALVIGIGININAKRFKDKMNNTPTSIYLETGKTIDTNEFKRDVYDNFNKLLTKIETNYIQIINDKYNYLKDKEVYIQINNIFNRVKVICINEDNSLKVEMDDNIIDIYSGEVSIKI